MKGAISLDDIPDYECDYIGITSIKYYDKIKNTIIKLIGHQNENNTILLYNIMGDFGNS